MAVGRLVLTCQVWVWWTRHINDSTNWQQLNFVIQQLDLVSPSHFTPFLSIDKIIRVLGDLWRSWLASESLLIIPCAGLVSAARRVLSFRHVFKFLSLTSLSVAETKFFSYTMENPLFEAEFTSEGRPELEKLQGEERSWSEYLSAKTEIF